MEYKMDRTRHGNITGKGVLSRLDFGRKPLLKYYISNSSVCIFLSLKTTGYGCIVKGPFVEMAWGIQWAIKWTVEC